MATPQRRSLNYVVDSEGRVTGVIVPIKEYQEMKDGRLEYAVVIQRREELRQAIPAIKRQFKTESSRE